MEDDLIDELEGELEDATCKSRIGTAQAASMVASQLMTDDDISSQNRAMLDGMIDGEPPYNQKDLEENGQFDRINISTKDATALEKGAKDSYYDLLTSVERFADCQVDYGDAQQKPRWAKIIWEEVTRTIRNWGAFNPRMQNLHTAYVRHGVAIAFWEDESNWQFRTCGLEDFKIQRNTNADEEEIEVALIRVPYTVSKLWSLLKDEEAASAAGWDVEQGRSILLKCVNDLSEGFKGEGQAPESYSNWEKLQRQLKEGDIRFGSSDYHIWLYHMWVKEYDGTITHLVIPENPSSDEFLCHNKSRYESIHQCFVVFTYGVGGGTYHTIRGMAWSIFDQEQAYARLWNTVLDGAMANCLTLLKPVSGSNTDVARAALSMHGQWAIVNGGYEIQDRTIPDFTKSAFPALQELKEQIRNNTLGYQTSPSVQNATDMPVKNYEAYLAQEGALADSALDLWYAPWGRLLAEIMRRMQVREYGPGDVTLYKDEKEYNNAARCCPGYKEVLALKKRLLKRDVPLEAFYTATDVIPVRATGSGSKQARLAAYDAVIATAGSTDEEGRYNLIRDRNALMLGSDQIEQYFKKDGVREGLRFAQDEKNANFENTGFKSFNTSMVSPSDNQSIHCAVHAGLIQAVMDSASEGGKTDPADLEHAFKVLQVAVPHFTEHVVLLQQDSARAKEGKWYKQLAQQASAQTTRMKDQMVKMVEDQQKQLEAEQKRAQDAEQARVAELEKKASETDSSDPMANAKLQAAMVSHQVQMRMDQERFNLKQNQLKAELSQKLAYKDAENALKILGS